MFRQQLEHVDKICDGCMISKYHRLSVLCVSSYRSVRALDLVYSRSDQAGGNYYFLLVVHDYGRYTWLEVLITNGEAF